MEMRISTTRPSESMFCALERFKPRTEEREATIDATLEADDSPLR